jgi:hypothetical protein
MTDTTTTKHFATAHDLQRDIARRAVWQGNYGHDTHDDVVITQTCHRASGVDVHHKDGVITLQCHVCHDAFLSIAVRTD